MKKLIPMLMLATGGAFGCQGETTFNDANALSTEKRETVDPKIERPSETPENNIQEPNLEIEFELSGDEATTYMSAIAPLLTGAPLSIEDRAQLESNGYDAVRPILETWTETDGFASSMKDMMQNKLKVSGARGDIDFELPGQLVSHVVQNELPMSEILTADYCIDSSGAETACDTGAPYTAGLLTTRAFLASNASRFNLGRASTLMRVFACRVYPMEDTLQPRAGKPQLIEMFRAETPEEQTVEEAKDAFGNGHGCYTCHGQFGLHAQLFVKYNEDGGYVADADGLQDPEGELGRSIAGLMTSHMEDVQNKSSENSQMFGEPVANLAEAGAVMAKSDVFLPCMTRNMLEYAFGLTDSEIEGIRHQVLTNIGARLRTKTDTPNFGDVMIETFSDPQIVRVVVPEAAQ